MLPTFSDIEKLAQGKKDEERAASFSRKSEISRNFLCVGEGEAGGAPDARLSDDDDD